MIEQYNEHPDLKGKNLTKAHLHDAGYDIKTPVTVTIYPQTTKLISTGLHVRIPTGLVGLIKSRSGLACFKHLSVLNAGVIDAGFHGEILIPIHNHSPRTVELLAMDRIAQIMFLPSMTINLSALARIVQGLGQVIPETDIKTWPATDRGFAGYGSTGR